MFESCRAHHFLRKFSQFQPLLRLGQADNAARLEAVLSGL